MRVGAGIGAVAMVVLSAAPAAADSGGLDSLVAAERAFAALASSHGMKHAFLTYLAPEAVVFQPRATPGRALWESRPDAKGTLLWAPAFAAVSSAGDFGYSSGPWEFRPPADSAGTPSPPESWAHGQFNSVWSWDKRDGWRVIADIGVSHPRPARGGVANVELTAGPTLRPKTMRTGRRDLPGEDERLSRLMSERGAREALAALGASDLRLNTDGRLPALGLDAAQTRLDSLGGAYEYRTEGSEIARSGDLGYTYGLAARRLTPGAAPADTSVYLHVWRQEAGRHWRLALAVLNPLPAR